MENKDYDKVMAELEKKCRTVRYFTKSFYETFVSCREAVKKCNEEGRDDSYMSGNVRLRHSYDPVYRSDFYVKNSCAYCAFLEIVL